MRRLDLSVDRRRLSRALAVIIVGLTPAAAIAQTQIVMGTAGDDVLTGSPAADTIYGLEGNDAIDGGGGDDDLSGGHGANDIRGGTGADAVLYGDAVTSVAVTLDNVANDGAGGADNVHGDVEQVYGGPAGDRLAGNASANLIDGGAGNDVIDPGGGEDAVYAGDGDDTITTADRRADLVDCGPGRDTATADDDDQLIGCETRTSMTAAVVPIRTTGGLGEADRRERGLSRRAFCQGTFALTLLKGSAVLGRKTIRLNGKCRWAWTFRVSRAKLGNARTLRLRKRFSGNRYLKPGQVVETIRVPRS